MTYRIRIEGEPLVAVAQDDETILAALQRNGVGFAYSCQTGNCGTCKCEHLAGSIDELAYSEHALAPVERERGIVLACRTRGTGEVLIRRLSAEPFVLHPARAMRCRLAEKAWLTHDVVRLRFAIESGGPYTFSPGQFAKLQFAFAPDTARDYSMAGTPDEPLEFHVRVMAGGVSGQVRDALNVGDAVRISGPFGTSYLREQHRGPIIAIAGGTGLAPIRAIVRRALELRLPGPIRLYLGAREERDVYGEEELRAWAARHPDFEVCVVLSQPNGAARRRRIGMVTEVVREALADLAGFHAYLAGPPAMVEAAVDLLHERGMASRDIHADAFYGAAAPQPLPIADR
jgi:CDP-4-dehydro-6-deoxyglucose reductase/ferredoxin-NAD(P)+ reductase (naphthalene dioxygenase ferredoxin-specific)